MDVRFVQLADEPHADALARYLNGVDGPVVLMAFLRPYATLLKELADRAIDTSRIYTVDATGQNVVETFRPDAFFIDSPTKLEKIAMITGKVLEKQDAGTTLILDTYPFVVQFNGPGAAVEFIHLMANKCRSTGNPFHILSPAPAPELGALVDDSTEVIV